MLLKDWQSTLQQSILNREDQLAGLLKGSDDQRTTRLLIYQDAYLLRLAEALEANYPVLYQLLEDIDFGKLFLRFHAIYPSKHPSIRWFGSQLSQYLRSDPIYNDRPVLSELADFEWAIRHTIDAADSPSISFDTLAALTPEEWVALPIRLHPASRVLELNWDAPAFWQSIQDGTVPPREVRLDSAWLIFRAHDGSAHWRSVDNHELRMLRCMEFGVTFGDLCERVSEWIETPDEAPAKVALLLRQLVDEGLLIVRSGDPNPA